MSRAWALVITVFAVTGVLAIATLIVIACIFGGEPVVVTLLLLLMSVAPAVFLWFLATTIYRKLRAI